MADLLKLLPVLNTSGIQKDNPALYQVVSELLRAIISIQNTLDVTPITSEGEQNISDGSGAGLAIITNVSSWTRIGDIIVAMYNVTYPVTANGANAAITGLPFSAERLVFGAYGVLIGHQNKNLPGMTALISNGTNTIIFFLPTGVQVTNAQLSAGNLVFTAIYKASPL